MAAIFWLLGQLFRSRPQGLRPEKVPTAAESLFAIKWLRMRDVASQLLTAGDKTLPWERAATDNCGLVHLLTQTGGGHLRLHLGQLLDWLE